jgi:hypothetical protein
MKLKKQRRAKGSKTAQKPLKTHLKQLRIDTNEVKTTPIPLSSVALAEEDRSAALQAAATSTIQNA